MKGKLETLAVLVNSHVKDYILLNSISIRKKKENLTITKIKSNKRIKFKLHIFKIKHIIKSNISI